MATPDPSVTNVVLTVPGAPAAFHVMATPTGAVCNLDCAFGATLSRIGVQQNDDMRRMPAWVAIAAMVTLLAGTYGMNFMDMPQLEGSVGYPLALGVMAGLGLWLHHKFKRGWL
jgi:Mg2+ and Co2+ transporter CorA